MAHQPEYICSIVPPYLLKAIAQKAPDEKHRAEAAHSLAQRAAYTQVRKDRLAALGAPRGFRAAAAGGSSHGHGAAVRSRPSIVPTVLLQHIIDSPSVDEATKECARRDLDHIKKVHGAYQTTQTLTSDASPFDKATTTTKEAEEEEQEEEDGEDEGGEVSVQGGNKKKGTKKGGKKRKDDAPATQFYRAVYDMKSNDDEGKLPGQVLRVEGQNAVADESANEAYDNVGWVLKFYLEKFNWRSIDNNNKHVVSSVHFGKGYENAFWDPEKEQMVYGDGATFLYHFTKCVDVIGHEITHAVTEHTSPLDYEGQSGALNEHVSDVFGIMVKQFKENEKASEADWLIGEGCLLPDIKGVALRSMKAPGTAYDDPRFGKDPQPDNFKDYKTVTDDEGGVHLYSGIPNKAFYLASVAFGGYAWEKAGQIWWKTLNSGRVPTRCNFVQFADVTVEVADEEYGEEAARTVRDAWNQVGVKRKGY